MFDTRLGCHVRGQEQGIKIHLNFDLVKDSLIFKRSERFFPFIKGYSKRKNSPKGNNPWKLQVVDSFPCLAQAEAIRLRRVQEYKVDSIASILLSQGKEKQSVHSSNTRK